MRNCLVCTLPLLFLALYTQAQSGVEPKTLACEIANLPIQIDVDTSTLKFERLDFTSPLDYGSFASIDITNAGVEGISRAFFVVDFLNNAGKVVTTVPLTFHADAQLDPFELWLPQGVLPRSNIGISPGHFRGVLRQGQREEVDGANNLVLTDCPTKGRIAYVTIEFESRKRFHIERPDWRLDPMYTDFRTRPVDGNGCPLFQSIDLSSIGVHPPSHVVGEVEIDDLGCSRLLELRDGTPALRAKLSENVRQWSLAPAIHSGTPVVSKITVLYRFLNSYERVPSREQARQMGLGGRFVVVDLFRDKKDSHKVYVSYAGVVLPGREPVKDCR